MVVGDGPQFEKYGRRLVELGLADVARLVGRQENVPEWLGALDIFVLPSYGDEGVPQSVMQAMACARPIVSTTIGAIHEAVVDGETGILVPPKDTAALAAALARLMNDPALRERLAAAGLERARSRFGIALMLDRMEAVFRRFAPTALVPG